MKRMCEVLGVSRSGYYAWRQRPPGARKLVNQQLLTGIREVYQESDAIYGSPRSTRALWQQGGHCGENRVARLMRAYEIQANVTRRFHSTTRGNPGQIVAPNLLPRAFMAARPNEIRLADMTYIPTQEGWL